MKLTDINTDLAEGKLLMAALALLTTTTEEVQTLDEVLAEVSESADKMFEIEAEDLRDPADTDIQ